MHCVTVRTFVVLLAATGPAETTATTAHAADFNDQLPLGMLSVVVIDLALRWTAFGRLIASSQFEAAYTCSDGGALQLASVSSPPPFFLLPVISQARSVDSKCTFLPGVEVPCAELASPGMPSSPTQIRHIGKAVRYSTIFLFKITYIL